MKTNIEKIQISEELDIKKYPELVEKVNKSPELAEMVNLFQQIEKK